MQFGLGNPASELAPFRLGPRPGVFRVKHAPVTAAAEQVQVAVPIPVNQVRSRVVIRGFDLQLLWRGHQVGLFSGPFVFIEEEILSKTTDHKVQITIAFVVDRVLLDTNDGSLIRFIIGQSFIQ
jgi:hypothetical protein